MKTTRSRWYVAGASLFLLLFGAILYNANFFHSNPVNESPLKEANNGTAPINPSLASAESKPHAQRVIVTSPAAGIDPLNRRIFTAQVERTFGAALTTLNLSAKQLEQVKSLLFDRLVGEMEAHDIAVANGLKSVRQLLAAEAQADQENDKALAELLSPETFSEVSHLIGIQKQLAMVGNSYDPPLLAAGVPLSGQQTVLLAEARKSYIDDVFYKLSDASAKQEFRASGIDSVGLSSTDRSFISGIQSFLSPQQVQVLSGVLRKTTARYASNVEPNRGSTGGAQ